RRQHHEKFLPGLAKLGLGRLPHAVGCAQYHYLSNQVGGVKTEYARESDRKAWVRYPPPRWIWYGASICGIPSRVNAAMLHGWHGDSLDTALARYAMQYVRTTLPVVLALLGPDDTRALLGHAARLIGMQYHDETARLLEIDGRGPEPFARYLAALAEAQGEAV